LLIAGPSISVSQLLYTYVREGIHPEAALFVALVALMVALAVMVG
jgi:hypothetical protein